MNKLLPFLLAFMPLADLVKVDQALASQAKEKSSVSLHDLARAPSEILLDGRSLALSAYPWRDFMPTFSDVPLGPGGKPLAVALKVSTADNTPLPSGIRADGAWVIFGKQIWEIADLRRHMLPQSDNKDFSKKWINCPALPVCEFSVRDGPNWGPGVLVDVVVRLTDKNGRRYLLRAPKQLVQRTD